MSCVSMTRRAVSARPYDRGQSPLIRLATCPSGADARSPKLTVVPRSMWSSDSDGNRLGAVYFDKPGFDRDKQYFVCFELRHPGSLQWPFGFVQEVRTT
jgi:hypothetical protein